MQTVEKPIESYADALAYLESFDNYEQTMPAEVLRELPADRMRRLCQRLGDPQRWFRSVVVTGTNGKGSIAALLHAMLRASGLRVGLYTSPHVEDLRERIRVTADGGASAQAEWIPEEQFTALVRELRPALEAMRREPWGVGAPTYFEVLTAVAFCHFRACGVQTAVLEVGLGGRLDATNVGAHTVSIFGPIDLDHVDILGADRATVAREKAAIVHAGQAAAITVPQPDDVMAVLQAACGASGVPLLVIGRDIEASIERHSVDGLTISVRGQRAAYEHLAVPLLGRHQAENVAAAIAALEVLSEGGAPHGPVSRGLAAVEWPGRIEAASREPLILLDGAHNPHAAGALARTVAELCEGRRLHLLIGMSADKSVEDVARILGPLAADVTCTRSRHPRALRASALARRIAPFCQDVHVMSDPVDACTYLLNVAEPADVILVTGSFFLVGQVRSALRQALQRSQRRRAGQLQVS